jgi:type VI protein secretion system component Hcp
MAVVILEIPSIQGESGVANYQNMILCDSMGQDIELEIEVTQNARRTFHVPKVNNITLERKMDKATAGLIKSILSGKVDTSAWKIHCLKALDQNTATMQVEFMTITLVNPILSKHTLSVSESDTTESFEINSSNITWVYTPYGSQNNAAGQLSVQFDTIAGTIQ